MAQKLVFALHNGSFSLEFNLQNKHSASEKCLKSPVLGRNVSGLFKSKRLLVTWIWKWIHLIEIFILKCVFLSCVLMEVAHENASALQLTGERYLVFYGETGDDKWEPILLIASMKSFRLQKCKKAFCLCQSLPVFLSLFFFISLFLSLSLCVFVFYSFFFHFYQLTSWNL